MIRILSTPTLSTKNLVVQLAWFIPNSNTKTYRRKGKIQLKGRAIKMSSKNNKIHESQQLVLGDQLDFGLLRNRLTAAITGRGFSRCTACPEFGISIIGGQSVSLVTLLIFEYISLAIFLSLISFSPTTSKRGNVQFFRSSHRDLP